MPRIDHADQRTVAGTELRRPRIVGFPPIPEKNGAEHRFLLMRLGLGFRDCETLASVKRAALLPQELRARLEERLKRERLRLGRLARARSLAYDINRHIAVRAAMIWMEDTSPA